MAEGKQLKVVLGTIGRDAHIVGSWVLRHALEKEGINAIYLGGQVTQEEYVAAAVETDADAIWVSSMAGMGRLDCRGLREKCVEAGLKNVLLYAGGMLVSSKDLATNWEFVQNEFKEMGFDRVYPPETRPAVAIEDLRKDKGLIS